MSTTSDGAAAASGSARPPRRGISLVKPVSLVRRGRKGPRPAPARRRLRASAVVDCAVYQHGHRQPGTADPGGALEHARRLHDGFVWLGLHEPDDDELAEVARIFGLPTLLTDHTLLHRRRPRLERHGDVLGAVFQTVTYVPHAELTATSEIVDTGHVSMFLGTQFVITVRRGGHRELQSVRVHLEAHPQLLGLGPQAVLYAVADRVADDAVTVVDALQEDVDELERLVFRSDTRLTDTAQVYQLKRELLEFKHATVPLAGPLAVLAGTSESLTGTAMIHGIVTVELQPFFQDVRSHLTYVNERVAGFDSLLDSMLTATMAQVSITQNEDMRKISAWVAIAAVPTLTAGIYGMNFEHMPELHQVWGYPAALTFMLLVSLTLYRTFKHNKWL